MFRYFQDNFNFEKLLMDQKGNPNIKALNLLWAWKK